MSEKLNSSDDSAKLSISFNYSELYLIATACGNFFPRVEAYSYPSNEEIVFLYNLRKVYKRLPLLIDENFE